MTRRSGAASALVAPDRDLVPRWPRIVAAMSCAIVLVAACGRTSTGPTASPEPSATAALPTAVVSISSTSDTPEGHVVRAWADALSADRDIVAAGYLAKGVDVGNGVVLRTETRILEWVTAFPCRVEVATLIANHEFVTLVGTSGGSRRSLTCLVPVGAGMTYQARVHDLKIVALVPGSSPSPGPSASPSP